MHKLAGYDPVDRTLMAKFIAREEAKSSYDKGNQLMDQGRVDEAKKMYEKALVSHLEYLDGGLDALLAAIYNNLGYVLETLGGLHLQEAKAMYEKALTTDIAVLKDENHMKIADTYNNLGNVLHGLLDFNGAKEKYQRALDIKKVCLPAIDLSLAASYYNLGLEHQSLKEFETAQKMHEEALRIRREFLKTDSHSLVAQSLDSLGDVYFELKKLDLAADFYTNAKASYQHSHGHEYDNFFDEKIAKCVNDS